MSEPERLIRFECRARSRQSLQAIEKISIDAIDKESALRQLHHDGYLVVSITELNASKTRFSALQQGVNNLKGKKKSSFSKKVSTRELLFFAVQLSTLLSSGVALVRALEILQKGTDNFFFSQVIKNLTRSVSEGHTLSISIEAFPKVFPPLWRNLIAVGELSGTLSEVLREIAAYQESSEKLKSKVISALFYPGILLTIAGGAVTFLMVAIIPKFTDLFAQQKMELPLITQVVVAISYALRHYLIFVIAGIAALVWLIRRYLKTPRGNLKFARIALKIPLIGSLVLYVAVVRFCRSFSTLLKAGIPLIKSLETASVLSGNAYIQKLVDESREAVSQGFGLGTQLESRNIFPVFVTQLISIGEETGEIESFLRLITKFYEERVDEFLSRLSVIIEPIMLVLMAAVIGVIIVAMFLPIMELTLGGGG